MYLNLTISSSNIHYNICLINDSCVSGPDDFSVLELVQLFQHVNCQTLICVEGSRVSCNRLHSSLKW